MFGLPDKKTRQTVVKSRYNFAAFCVFLWPSVKVVQVYMKPLILRAFHWDRSFSFIQLSFFLFSMLYFFILRPLSHGTESVQADPPTQRGDLSADPCRAGRWQVRVRSAMHSLLLSMGWSGEYWLHVGFHLIVIRSNGLDRWQTYPHLSVFSGSDQIPAGDSRHMSADIRRPIENNGWFDWVNLKNGQADSIVLV